MSQYLTVQEFVQLCALPDIAIDELESTFTGWLDATLASYSALIDAKLVKRYEVPFDSPPPEQVRQWLVRLVNIRAQIKRGIDPSNVQTQLLMDDAAAVLVELDAAANAVDGLWGLPLRGNTTASGIAKGRPLFRADQSPYAWMDRQAGALRNGR